MQEPKLRTLHFEAFSVESLSTLLSPPRFHIPSAHLAVAAHPDSGQQSREGGEDPPRRHDKTRVPEPKFAVETQGVCDGVPALQGDGC